MYPSNQLRQADCAQLEQQFLAQSNVALLRFLGMSTSKESGTPADALFDPRVAAKWLWGKDFVTALERRLTLADTLDEAIAPLILASTIPHPRVRDTVLRMLKKYSDEAPKAFATAYTTKNTMPEPGFWLIVKSLARKNPSALESSVTLHGNKSKTTAIVEAKQQRERTAKQWTEFSENVLQAMCRRFASTAAENTKGHAMNADDEVKLPPNAEIIAVYRRDWSEASHGASSDFAIPSMRITYVKAEQEGRPSKILGYFRRQLSGIDEHPMPQSVWMESLVADAERASASSIDVVVTRKSQKSPALADQEQRLVIEILKIECSGIAIRAPAAVGKKAGTSETSP
jgi:hypothetical protein